MDSLKQLFDQNKNWAKKVTDVNPDFFENLSKQQSPEFLWIGCSDSRVPSTQIVDVMPGEIFVHRNVANLVIHTDFNCLSVIQYAVDVLKVKHIVICGHYACGGINAALENSAHGLIDNWLQTIKKIQRKFQKELDKLPQNLQGDRLAEINIVEQVINMGRTTIVENAWSRGQKVVIHGWIYGIKDGILKSLDVDVRSPKEVDQIRDAIDNDFDEFSKRFPLVY